MDLLEKAKIDNEKVNSKPRLTDLVDLEKDIVPYNLNIIYAGVGSGKNSIIVGYHDEKTNYDGLAEKYRVLLITSRTAKVKETKKDPNGKRLLTDIRHMNDVKWDKLKSRSVICTNAHFQKRVEDWWDPILDTRAFWEKFDFIVIDEVHSLVTDATFAGSSSILYYFIEHLCSQYSSNNNPKVKIPKLVLMSGTPEPVAPLIKPYNPHVLDYRRTAINISPDEYCIINYQKTKEKIKEKLKQNERVVYYLTVFDKIDDIISEALNIGISEKQIVVSVSDSTVNRELYKTYPTIFKNKVFFEEDLTKEQISDDFLLIITNSKNKEGINIKSKLGLLVMETHFQPDIVQICGRFRNGILSATIVSDARQFQIPAPYIEEQRYQWSYGLNSANSYLEQILEEEKIDPNNESVYTNERVTGFIEYIEKGSRFLRYNPFKGRFDENRCFLQAYNYYNQSIMEFYDFSNDPSSILQYAPTKKTTIRICTEYATVTESITDYFIKKHIVVGETILTHEQGVEMVNDLNELCKKICKNPRKYSQLKSLLKVFGYDIKRIGKLEKGRFIIIPYVPKGKEK